MSPSRDVPTRDAPRPAARMSRGAATRRILGLLLVTAALLGAPWVPAQARHVRPSSTWTLDAARSDEFNGAALDAAKWSTSRGGFAGSPQSLPFNPPWESAFYDPDNVTEAAGALTLAIRAQVATLNGTTYTMSSGMIHSVPRFTVARTAGHSLRVEARIFVPDQSVGLWPALWLDNADHDVSPYALANQASEADIVEMWTDGATGAWRQPWFNYHYWNGLGITHEAEAAYGAPSLGAWHTYGVELTDTSMIPTWDGVAYPAAGRSEALPAGRPMDLIIDLAAARCIGHGGWECPTPAWTDGQRAGQSMAIDWVRTYVN